MIRESAEARDRIDAAAGMRFGPEREAKLKSALAELGDPGGADDDIEARAVALALLAESDPGCLPDAEDALAAARRAGAETNWISLHLVDAYYIARDYGQVISHAREIDRSYFDDQDLHWRPVKAREILAAALLAHGDLDEGLEVATQVIGEIARRGGVEDDDLMSPYELTRCALDLVHHAASARARDTGYKILHDISASIELKVWLPRTLVDQVTSALAACRLQDDTT